MDVTYLLDNHLYSKPKTREQTFCFLRDIVRMLYHPNNPSGSNNPNGLDDRLSTTYNPPPKTE